MISETAYCFNPRKYKGGGDCLFSVFGVAWSVMPCRVTQVLKFQIKFFIIMIIFPVLLSIIAVLVQFNIPLLFLNNFCIDFCFVMTS